MRICFIEPHLLCVGGIRRIIEVANRLKKRGHFVRIYTPPGRPCGWMESDVEVEKISKLPHRVYDIALFNLAEQYPVAIETKARMRVFWVLAPEALYKDPNIPIKALRQNFHFLANSTFSANYIKRFRKVKEHIPIIPGGINPEHFKFVPKTPKKYDILYYGSPRPWKGGHLVEGSLRGYKLLKMHGLNTPQDKIHELYNQSTIFVSANQMEGFSFMQLEAMACGCPVVTTDDGGSQDYIKSGYNAVVVSRSHSGLQTGASILLGDKNLRAKLRRNGLVTSQDPKFSWDNVTEELEQYFLHILQ